MCLNAGDKLVTRRVIAITGGIGSGKSVVCRIVSSMGYPVYDCDYEAKRLMDSDNEIKKRIVAEICEEAVVDGVINRKLLAELVFSDKYLLAKLNAIVHGAVRYDFLEWCEKHNGTMFVESAILYESGFDKHVDEVWEVVAPKRVRILRACKRDNANERSVISRIERQEETVVAQPHQHTHEIVNDDVEPVLPQVLKLLL